MVRIHNVSVTLVKQRKSSNPLKNTRDFYVICPDMGVRDGARSQWCKSMASVESGQDSQKRLPKGMSFVLVTSQPQHSPSEIAKLTS